MQPMQPMRYHKTAGFHSSHTWSHDSDETTRSFGFPKFLCPHGRRGNFILDPDLDQTWWFSISLVPHRQSLLHQSLVISSNASMCLIYRSVRLEDSCSGTLSPGCLPCNTILYSFTRQ